MDIHITGGGVLLGGLMLAMSMVIQPVHAAADAVKDRIEAFRAQLLAKAQEQAGRAEAVAVVEDRTIPGPAGDIRLRIYTPSSGSIQRPAILYIHGAGWVGGSVATHDNITRKLANALGAVVVSVDYRLAPEYPYPVSLEESYASLLWLRDEAAALAVDPARIIIMGDSAGGNLAAALALLARDRQGPDIRAQVLINPALNLDTLDTERPCRDGADTTAFMAGMVFFRDNYLSADMDRRAAYVSPLYAPDLSRLPPAFIITGELDLLCRSGEAYGERLRASGVLSEGARMENAGHFGMVWAAAEPASDEAFRQVVAYLQRTL